MSSLEDIRILDLSRLLPGPYATQLLADFGAEVIKVERPPEGDYLRTAPPLIDLDGHTVGAVFAQVNRAKKSVCIDFSSERGRHALLKLTATSDVFVESFRPTALERRGLGYEDVRAVNPRIIYCSLSGYGQHGPYRNRAGHDLNYVALSGILNLNGAHHGRPAPFPVQVADLSGAMLAALKILAAVVERERTGVGTFLDVALIDGAFDWMQTIVGASYRAEKTTPRRGELPLAGAYPCYNVYETYDGRFVSLAALEPSFWITFCQAVDRPDLIELQLDAAAIETVDTLFRSRPLAEWKEFAKRVDVCLEPLLEIDEALTFEQAKARGLVDDDRRHVPQLGADTRAVLESAGLSRDEIETLFTAGTIGEP